MKNMSISDVARMGARALNSKLSPAQRKRNARKAAKARWAKHK